MTERKIGFRPDRLKNLREEIVPSLSQTSLAEAIGVRQKDVSGWEVGDHAPNYENLVSLAKYFKVTIDYLLGAVDGRTQVASVRQHPELLERLWIAVQKGESVEAMELLARLLKGEE